jgi:hypothetical protein
MYKKNLPLTYYELITPDLPESHVYPTESTGYPRFIVYKSITKNNYLLTAESIIHAT